MAKYVLSNDPKVQEFLQYLGVDIDLTWEAVITVSTYGKPVNVTVSYRPQVPDDKPALDIGEWCEFKD